MVKKLADQHGAEQLIVVFGVNQPRILEIMTRTFREGDPSFAGLLAGVALQLPCYHILELKGRIPAEVWGREMSMHELELDEEEQARIVRAMQAARGE